LCGRTGPVRLNEVDLLFVLESKKHADLGDHKNPAFEAEMKEAEEHLEKLAVELEADGMKVNRILKHGNPAAEIVETAKEKDADLIFLGARGKGLLGRAFLGSVSEQVVKLADRPVMVQFCRVVKKRKTYSCENVCSSLFGISWWRPTSPTMP